MSQGFTKGVPIDTDVTLSANSNLLVPSQFAVRTYVTNELATNAVIPTRTITTTNSRESLVIKSFRICKQHLF
jgi:hypothetical protein